MEKNIVDRKFKILAVNPVSGKIYDESNSLLLCAKDKAVIPALLAYKKACVDLDANFEHIESVGLLIDRLYEYQETIEARVPDTVGDEIPRCIDGILGD